MCDCKSPHYCIIISTKRVSFLLCDSFLLVLCKYFLSPVTFLRRMINIHWLFFLVAMVRIIICPADGREGTASLCGWRGCWTERLCLYIILNLSRIVTHLLHFLLTVSGGLLLYMSLEQCGCDWILRCLIVSASRLMDLCLLCVMLLSTICESQSAIGETSGTKCACLCQCCWTRDRESVLETPPSKPKAL